MKKIIRGIRIADASVVGYRRIRARDEILSAVDPGKILALGTTWRGSLKPLVDAIVETLAPLSNGLTSGNALHAEAVPATLALGRAWVGNLASEIRSAAANTSAGPTVDVGEVIGAVEKLCAEMHADPVDFPGVADALRRVRVAADRVGAYARTRDAGGSAHAKQLVAVTPASIKFMEGLNAQARAFHAAQSTPATSRPIGDSGPSSAVRDALATAARAKDMRTKMAALNRAAAAFWART